MGNILRIWGCGERQNEKRVMMMGLDNTGKTQLLYQLRLGEWVTVDESHWFNIEDVKYKDLKMTIWDLPGSKYCRASFWKNYHDPCDALIYVVDSTDADRLKEARQELFEAVTLSENMSRVPVLILANKQDLPNAVPPRRLAIDLELDKLPNHTWHIQGTSAKTRIGLDEALVWLYTTFEKLKV